MKKVLCFVAVVLVGLVSGCAPQADLEPINTVEHGGLSVQLELAKRDFMIGEQFRVDVTASNNTSEPMGIVARSGAPVYVRIWRFTGMAWDEVKTYPEASIMVMRPWTLPAGEDWKFSMLLSVEPDWPTGEVL